VQLVSARTSSRQQNQRVHHFLPHDRLWLQQHLPHSSEEMQVPELREEATDRPAAPSRRRQVHGGRLPVPHHAVCQRPGAAGAHAGCFR